MVLLEVPRIDRLAGIKLYSTNYPGTGGIIKEKTEDFKVIEILHDSILNSLVQVKNEKHQFPLYCLEKNGLDSTHALMEIKNELGINLRLVGIKDSKAISRQYCTNDQKIDIRDAKTTHTSLSLMGYTAQALRKSHLVGNKFEIVIRHMKNKHLLNFLEEASGIPNFYGLQRFGSARLVTHLVGRQIVKKDFSGAVHTLLSYTTEYDTKFSRELREKCKDPRNYRSVLKNMPRGMDIERLVLISLLSGKNHISSLRSVPINIRRLFVHAYQAFLFNECISSLIKEGQDITRCVAEDLCFELEDVCVLGKLRKFTFGMNQDKIVPATQLVGYAFRNREGRFEKTMFRVLSDEGLTPKDFFVSNMQELSVEGGFRQLPLMVKDLDYDPDYGIKFRLPVGAYATTLLRELIKPANPINAGF